jgi:hypothetical protein
MFKIKHGWIAGGMLLALIAAPGRADVKQVKLGVKGATCAT